MISTVVAVQSGNQRALATLQDFPSKALGAELGSPYHIPLWLMETVVNQLFTIPKAKNFGIGRTRVLKANLFQTLRVLQGILIKLENASDGIFLKKYDVFYEMARIAQRQFPWQRGVMNVAHLYRSMLLYGSGSARDYFEMSADISLSDFVKIGACMSGALKGNAWVNHQRSLSEIGISPEVREAAFRKLVIPHIEARQLSAQMQKGYRHIAYPH